MNHSVYWSRSSVCVSVCVAVCRRVPTVAYCTDLGVTWRNGRGCPLVVYHWADLQSVHRFRCYDNTVRTRNVGECFYLFYAWLSFVSTTMNDMATVYVDWTHSATHRTDVNQTAEFRCQYGVCQCETFVGDRLYKNSPGDEIANVNFYAVRPGSYPNSTK